MLRRNGYVLEQVTSPLVVQTSEAHVELLTLVPGCVTRHHAHHYLGFARNQWGQLQKEPHPQAKTLLYAYRVLLTGLHLMRTGQVEANLATLNLEARLSCIPDLIAAKTAGEHAPLSEIDRGFHEREIIRLTAELEASAASSMLPETPSAGAALSDLLVRLRLSTL
jgi:predicted nucleotidyltransferase